MSIQISWTSISQPEKKNSKDKYKWRSLVFNVQLDDQILIYFKTDSLWLQNFTWYLLNLSHIFQAFLSSGGKIAFDSLKLIMELYSITENTKDEEGKINNLGWMKHTNNSRPVTSL